MRHLATSPETEQVCVPLIIPGSAGSIRSVLLKELFGVSAVGDLTTDCINRLKLARHPGLLLTQKKIKSISKKYFSIPVEYLSYYPVVADGVSCDDDDEDEVEDTQARILTTVTKRKSLRNIDAVGACKPSCPKKAAPPLANQKSIMTFSSSGFSSGKDK
ncbi:unnamed protein product [Calypogeia fissa]